MEMQLGLKGCVFRLFNPHTTVVQTKEQRKSIFLFINMEQGSRAGTPLLGAGALHSRDRVQARRPTVHFFLRFLLFYKYKLEMRGFPPTKRWFYVISLT